jgi:dihydrofolate reductase
MPWAHRLLITEVEQSPEGDVRFPEINPARWREVSREARDGFSWVAYERA